MPEKNDADFGQHCRKFTHNTKPKELIEVNSYNCIIAFV